MQQMNKEGMDMEMAGASMSAGKKESKGMMMGMIMCSVLAIVGIGFGVYGMTKKPEEKPAESTANTELETELSEIKQKYSVLQNYVKELEASGTEVPEEAKSATETPASTSASFHNAIIASNDATILTQTFQSDDYYNERRSISIDVSNGEITWCKIFKPSEDNYGKKDIGDCKIEGLSGRISAISQMGNTQMSWPYIGFLMEDGSVEYVSAFDLTDKFTASAGKLNIEFNKPVTNIINSVGVKANNPDAVGGHQTTVFYHSDGSFSVFNDSMVSK